MIDNGWKAGLQIDRIDNDMWYAPQNCRIVTAKVNARNRSSTILDVESVREIKALLSIRLHAPSRKKIAGFYGVSTQTISDIKNGRSWKEV